MMPFFIPLSTDSIKEVLKEAKEKNTKKNNNMKVKDIFFSETFPLSNGHYQKIGATVEIEGDDDPKKALYTAKQLITNFFYESNKAAEKKEQEISADAKISLSEQISTVTDLKVLDTYKMLVRNDPDANKAYREKLIELSNGSTS
jgi:hypothetical protein